MVGIEEHQKKFDPRFFLAAFLWMAVIFYLSAQPDLKSSLPSFYDYIARKFAHAIEYGILFYFWSRVFKNIKQSLLLAASITLFYAVSDEWHQTFVHGRVGSPVDVLIDMLGMGLVFLYIKKPRR